MKIYYLIRRLLTSVPNNRTLQFILLVFLMIATSFAEILSIGAVLPFLGVLSDPDSFLKNPYIKPVATIMGISNSRDLLLPLTVVFCLSSFVAGSMRFSLLWAQTRLSHSIGTDLRVDIYRRTLYQPYAVHLGRNTSEIISGISQKTSLVVEQVLFTSLLILSATLMLVSISTVLITIDYRIALFGLFVFALLYSAVAVFMKNILARNSKHISIGQDRTIKALQEGLGGIKEVLIDGSQETYAKIFKDSDVELRRGLTNVQIISVSPRYFIEVTGMVVVALMALTLTKESDGIGDVIPVLGAFALGLMRLLPVVQQIYQSFSQIRGAAACLKDVVELLEQPMPDVNLPEKLLPLSFQEDIVIEDVHFHYSKDLPWVLKGINFRIPKGAKVGIIGATGSGKSTVLNILMGLLTPVTGSFFVDNIKIDSSNYRNWQLNIAHVPQTIFLSDNTIAENIAFGVSRSEIDYERLKIACAMAQIDELIESWEFKYDTPVGERGIRLSGGQLQRVGIARALYKESKFIVLDEATSALDNITEENVMNAISNISDDVTILIVAHRLNTLKRCDFIINIHNGSVNKVGTYDDITGA